MKNLLTILIFLTALVKGFTQDPYLVFDNPSYNDKFSCFFNFGDKAIISYNSQYHDYSGNNHISFCNQFVISEDGFVSDNVLIDSINYSGFGTIISSYVNANTSIYQFGSLLGNSATDYRFLIRETTMNLNLIKDTIINLNNSIISVTDAIADSNTFLVSGSSYDGNNSYGFVFRIDSTLNIVDSVYFPVWMAYYLDFGFIKLNNSSPQLKITHGEGGYDIVISLNEYPLSIADTLYSAINGPYEFFSNSFPIYINDSIYITPISELTGGGTDSIYSTVGWLKWDSYSNIIDTILPLIDTVSSDFKANYKSICKGNQDSIIMGFSHGTSVFSSQVTSRHVGVLFSDNEGNISKRFFYGGDYYYTLENIFRFNNGNIVLLAYRQSTPNDPCGFVLWLIDSQGKIIQEIEPVISKQINLSLYPNPTTNHLNIVLQSQNKTITQLQIIDLQGKLIQQKTINSAQAQLNISKLAKGIYIIEGTTNTGERFSRKFVKE